MPARLGGTIDNSIVTTGFSSARFSTRSSSRGSRIDKAAIEKGRARNLPGEDLIARMIVEPSWLSPFGCSSISGINIIFLSLLLLLNSNIIVFTLL